MFTEEQHRTFREDGFVRLPGALPEAVVDDMLERLWSLLEAKGALRDDPSSWSPDCGFRLQAIRKGDPDPRACPPLRDALDAAFQGSEWATKPHWGQALVTFPTEEPWILPKRIWHLDHPFVQGRRLSGVNMFLFLDEVGPHGGGTAVLRSSPLLIERFVKEPEALLTMKAAEAKRRLFATHPFLEELTGGPIRPDRNERLMDGDSDVDGVAVRAVELSGRPGEVVLAHPWLLHAGAPNTSRRPRLMRASRVYRRSYYERFMKGAPSRD
jgi:hypothetical protein